MTFEPIIQAPLTIQLHLAFALGGLGLGAVQFARPKGTPSHRWLGRTWVALLAATAIGSFWIRGLNDGALGPIHALSAFTLAILALGIAAAWRGNIRSHRYTMIGVYCGALIGAGIGAMAPERLLWQVATGG